MDLSGNINSSVVGSSEAGGEGASGGREGRAGRGDAGEGPGGAEEERRGDQSASANRGQRTFLTGEEETEQLQGRKRENNRNGQDKIYCRFLVLLIWKSDILYLPPLVHISSSYITDPLHLMHPVRP